MTSFRRKLFKFQLLSQGTAHHVGELLHKTEICCANPLSWTGYDKSVSLASHSLMHECVPLDVLVGVTVVKQNVSLPLE